MPPNKEPTDAETQVLSVLWQKGPATARKVLESMPDGKQRSYTTVLSTMQVMEKKGLIKRQGKDGRALIYKPAVTAKRVAKPAFKDLLGRLFGGKPTAVVQHLLDTEKVSQAELDEIQAMLDQHRQKQTTPRRNKP